ncbi:DUF4389 domain-containing protein [Lysobacter korlensis]|uniref:DUF4389 domain-containing protein n=1 Tax=Lysobacter korlensis TaxID=553636 RepID=A0ABV6S058_9GAMM
MTSTTAPRDPAAGPAPSRGGVVLGAILLALGILISFAGGAVLTAGILAASADSLRDDDGFFTAPSETFTTDTYALTSPSVGRLTVDRGTVDLPFELATIRLQATDAGSEVFLGIGPQAEVDRFLGNVERTEIRELRYFPFEVEYRDLPGDQPAGAPLEQDFWVASATSGDGAQPLEWSIAPGDWAIVIMNADGSPGVTVDLQAGVRSDLFAPAVTTLLVVGGLLLLVGIPLLVIGAVTLGRGLAQAGSGPAGTSGAEGRAGAPAALPGRYPAEVVGVRDPQLSRWLWLVKWLLVLPHYLILIFLWLAFLVTTVIAGFAILFTGRYPRSLFTFNVGVLRWGWRVGFYAYSALGTDRYPPFTLAKADYPADFDVVYPEQLSRGLVLVKWWLLAIPHYLILGAISAGSTSRWMDGDGWGAVSNAGISLVGALVLVAGFALLFAARYPRGVFDLLVGINRWTLRVITYAALMRDEYPPFRLDQGPFEPAPTDLVPPDDATPAGAAVGNPVADHRQPVG